VLSPVREKNTHEVNFMNGCRELSAGSGPGWPGSLSHHARSQSRPVHWGVAVPGGRDRAPSEFWMEEDKNCKKSNAMIL